MYNQEKISEYNFVESKETINSESENAKVVCKRMMTAFLDAKGIILHYGKR
jgi:hypothetical protein